MLYDSAEQAARANMVRAQEKVRLGLRARQAVVEGLTAEAVAAFYPAISPGVERWPVKTGTDGDVATVVTTPLQTTVADLVVIVRPDDMPLLSLNPIYQSARSTIAERQMYVVDCEITGYRLEGDGDYHVVIRDDMNNMMIVEIPDGTDDAYVDPSSPFKAGIVAARQAFDGTFTVDRAMKATAQKARITGVGFFDKAHGQIGLAPNGIELHPVVDIQFVAN